MSDELEGYNAADPVKVGKRRRTEKDVQQTRTADLRAIMETPGGRRIVWWLLSDAHIYAASFHESALVMAHREGERNVGLRLLAAVMASAPDLYPTMISDNQEPSDG